MAVGGTCQTCTFFEPLGEDLALPASGYCRVNAPALVSDAAQGAVTRWPACTEADWCGRWQAATGTPVNLQGPTITGVFAEGQDVTISPGIWKQDLPMFFSYQWLDNAGPIEGATGLVYRLPQGSAGKQIAAVETAINANGATSANTPKYGPVAVTHMIEPLEEPG